MLVIILMCNSVFGPIHPQLLFRRGDVFLPEVSVLCTVRSESLGFLCCAVIVCALRSI